MDNLIKALSVFRGKRVLITGDTGFKGSWLSLWLSNIGADVFGYSLPPIRINDHFNTLKLADRVSHQDGDIRDCDQLSVFFSAVQPEIVFHMAAQALVRQSYQNPKETFDTNVGGSVNVLECVRSTQSVKTLIYITSDKCYKNVEWIWGYRENDELGGYDPYSASKAAAEIVISAYGDSFFKIRPNFGFASVRAGNVIGGGDWSEDRIVPDCMRALNEGKPIILRKPKATRPWQHVLEPLSGYILLAAALCSEPEQFSGAWNFGPDSDSSRSVYELAKGIVDGWGSGKIEIESSGNNPHEAGLLHLNCDKAHHLLGWKPRWDFHQTIEKTVEWYCSALSGEDICSLSMGQIQKYQEDIND